MPKVEWDTMKKKPDERFRSEAVEVCEVTVREQSLSQRHLGAGKRPKTFTREALQEAQLKTRQRTTMFP